MWIFLNNSFLSIVQANDDPDYLMVRARLRGDIERVFPRVWVMVNDERDYRFRARIDRALVADAMAEQVRGIDYGNFKDSVPDGARHLAYYDVWRIMLHEQVIEAQQERRKDSRGLLPDELVAKIQKPLPPEIVPPPLAPESKAAMKRKKRK